MITKVVVRQKVLIMGTRWSVAVNRTDFGDVKPEPSGIAPLVHKVFFFSGIIRRIILDKELEEGLVGMVCQCA